MPQHDYLSKVPLVLPESLPKNDSEWRHFVQMLGRHFNVVSGLNLKSGTLTSADDPAGTGYWIGWDKLKQIAVLFGDFDNGNYIRFSQRLGAFIIGPNTNVQQGDDIVYLVFGAQSGSARDGDTVTFNPPFPDNLVPKVMFGAGGITFDASAGTANDQAVEVVPLNLTSEGFTMSAKIYAIGATTARTLNFSGGAGVTADTVTKPLAAEAYDNTYTVSFSVTIAGRDDGAGGPIPSAADVGIYARSSGGSFVKYATVSQVNNTGINQTYAKEKSISVSGLGANAEFKIQIEKGSATLEGDAVTYSEAAITKSSATPDGSPPIPWMALAAR